LQVFNELKLHQIVIKGSSFHLHCLINVINNETIFINFILFVMCSTYLSDDKQSTQKIKQIQAILRIIIHFFNFSIFFL